MAEELLTVDEAAREVRFSPRTVRWWIQQGWLPAARFGRIYRIRREDWEHFKANSYQKVSDSLTHEGPKTSDSATQGDDHD